MQLSKEEYARKRIQELKILSLGITVHHHSANLVIPNITGHDVIFNQNLTTIKDSYILIASSKAVYLGDILFLPPNWLAQPKMSDVILTGGKTQKTKNKKCEILKFS